jgi:hypothetical protein
MDRDSLRYRILESAKLFKTSWINLGQALYSVWKDKLYKEWGYNSIESYTAREIGIRKQTAMKLLRSYYFLEKEEPGYLKEDYTESAEAGSLPTYESVDVLRMAKNKKILDEEDYASLKKAIFEKGRDARDARRDLTAMIRERQKLKPQEAWQKKKIATVKRFIGILKSLEREIETLKLLPQPLLRETVSLINKLEAQIR